MSGPKLDETQDLQPGTTYVWFLRCEFKRRSEDTELKRGDCCGTLEPSEALSYLQASTLIIENMIEGQKHNERIDPDSVHVISLEFFVR